MRRLAYLQAKKALKAVNSALLALLIYLPGYIPDSNCRGMLFALFFYTDFESAIWGMDKM
ncbi:MAG: hypothetical protein ABFC94_07235 [Syntrophomonas sp.]